MGDSRLLMDSSTHQIDQNSVADWFNNTYRDHGFGYLRPLAAYPIYMQLLEAQPGERLLDVACGAGLLLKAALMRGLDASGIDISSEAIALTKEFVPEAHTQVANAEELPFGDASFDMLTCIGSLERMFDRDKVLQEMRRVVRPGGRMCLMLRHARAVGWRLWRQALKQQNHDGPQGAKGLHEWRELLETSGFSVTRVEMDQWARQKLRRWLRLGRTWNYAHPEPVAKPLLSMQWAYEHIFILKR